MVQKSLYDYIYIYIYIYICTSYCVPEVASPAHVAMGQGKYIHSMKRRHIVHRVHTERSFHWKDSQNTMEFSGYSKRRLITQSEGDVL